MAATENALLLMLCLLLTGIAEGKRKKGNSNNNDECVTRHLCECGEKEIKAYEECWEKVQEPTIDYAVEKVQQMAMCKGFNGEMEKMTFRKYLDIYCKLPPADQKECFDDINREMMNRMRDLYLFPSPENNKEREGLEDSGICVQPYVMSCGDSKCL